jgi:hypothetical protein
MILREARMHRWWMAALLAVALTGPAAAQERFGSSEKCGACHRDIHRGWQASIHAHALDDPIFQQALQGVAPQTQLCLACHAPLAAATGDRDLKSHLSWEGVTCDFCHSIAEVTLGDPRTAYRLVPGDVERGPIVNAGTEGHGVEYSPLFGDALLCAGCHEFRPAQGAAVLTTYSEWQASPYPSEGVTCQTCHMGLTRANVVDPKVARAATSVVNLHEMPGGHSLDQLMTALRVNVDAERAGDSLIVRVTLANVGAGHAMPTGFPSRQVVLETRVTTPVDELKAERVYARTVLDEAGRPIVRDDEVMRMRSGSARDTRLAPRETRVERLGFAVPGAVSASVTVRLRYLHAPLGAGAPTTDQVFYSERRFLRGK